MSLSAQLFWDLPTILLNFAVMQAPLISYRLPKHLNIVDCATSVIPINDNNYRAVIEWFKACLRLSQTVSTANRDDYELSVIGNVKHSLANFFQRTELSLSTLIGLEREVTAMFHGLEEPPVVAKSKLSMESPNDPDDGTCEGIPPEQPDESQSGDDELSEAITALYKRFLWVAIASVILLILLLMVLATLCWLKKYIERDIKEIFVTCPSKDDLQDMSGKKSSMKAKRTMSRRSHYTPASEDVELPYEEDEEYLQTYGDNNASYAVHPVRVWMTPLTRKRQPGKPVKSAAKKSGAYEN